MVIHEDNSAFICQNNNKSKLGLLKQSTQTRGKQVKYVTQHVFIRKNEQYAIK